MRRIAAIAVAVVATAALAPPAGAADTAVDIEIAIDTTGSMTPSIENAKRDARKIVAETQQQLPNARFAIVQFRDEGDEPEYEVAQPVTESADAVAAAVAKLHAGGGGDSPEAYSLVFRRAVAGADELGFRPGSRRLLFVLGDAEPHGAGAAGLAGCEDRSADPNGLDPAAELAGLRRAETTLNLVLQRSSAQTTLRCYQSLASAAYGNGKATESGEAGGGCDRTTCPPGCEPPPPGPGPEPTPGEPVARPCPVAAPSPSRGSAPLAEAIRDGIAREFPAVAYDGPRSFRRGRSPRAALRVVNRAPKGADLTAVTVRLPRGLAYRRGSARGLTRTDPAVAGRRLTWTVRRRLAPGGRAALSFAVRAVARDRGTVRLAARLTLADGGHFTARRAVRARVL